MNNVTIDDVINNITYCNSEEIKKIEKAYDMAKCFHDGQKRESGENYISHPLMVSYILSEMHADSDTICASLLHDTLEDTQLTKEEIIEEFNLDVANLVDGVTKISKLNFSNKEEQNMANTRKIITSISTDVRIIIIKLADRLHNMRTLEYKTEEKKKENSLETIEIFAPLAYYIGAYRIKSELEDLSLKYLKPDMYKKIEEKKFKVEEYNKDYLNEMVDIIEFILNDKEISNEIKIRTKNIYGIYKKMEQGNKLSDIHDLLALKVMVDEIDNCYRALGLIHSKYKPVNSKFKDYICNPKTNMYKSLHTTLFTPFDSLVQTQIRTFDMDKIASFGLTAYWDINKGNARYEMQKELKRNSQILTSLEEINLSFRDNYEFVYQIKKELFGNKIYVYVNDGNIVEMPFKSTIIDLAYKIGDDIGNTMVSAIVNEKPVPVHYELKNKDRIKLITNDFSYGPREEWINDAKTSHAKIKIKEFNKNI